MSNFPIKHLIVHCSATEATSDISIDDIDKWHRARGFSMVGYHYYIKQNGGIFVGRQEHRQGAHVYGNNRNSLGICLEGGLIDGVPTDTFPFDQKRSLYALLVNLKDNHPEADIKGHRDYSPDLNGNGIIEEFEWTKQCPCFDVAEWWGSVNE